jgi:hypothetical protein
MNNGCGQLPVFFAPVPLPHPIILQTGTTVHQIFLKMNRDIQTRIYFNKKKCFDLK